MEIYLVNSKEGGKGGERRGSKTRRTKQKTYYNLIELILTISIIPQYVNGLKALIKGKDFKTRKIKSRTQP